MDNADTAQMYSIKDLSELAGYTSRVYTLISTLHRVHANAYIPPRGAGVEVYSLCDVQVCDMMTLFASTEFLLGDRSKGVRWCPTRKCPNSSTFHIPTW